MPRRMPRTLDQLEGLRAARWIRESTVGQADNFGPDAQREQQDRAIERWGLVDTGIAWQVAHSGRTIGTTAQFAEMMAAAGDRFDVLVVGYVSRFARDLRTAVNARHELHASGAVILFADERLLSSEEDRWDEWAREAVEAESYSRKLARRIREGYAAKRRRLGEPGGRPPFGWRRSGRPPALQGIDAELAKARSVFDAAARGLRDREVGARFALPIDTVRGILTNPIYIGQLRDGSPASVAPLIDVATWNRVQAVRGSRARAAGRPSVRRTYTLPMLSCGSCGRRLIGDSGRYRHKDPCDGFLAGRMRRAWKNQLRHHGQSYPKAHFEDLVGPMLSQIGASLETSDLTRAAALWEAPASTVDELALRRIEQERSRAATAYLAHRDPARLEAEMGRLDERQRSLLSVTSDTQTWPEVLQLLRDVPAMWTAPEATDEDRRELAEALFTRVEATGGRRLDFHFASGVQAAVSVGATGFSPTVTIIRAPWMAEQVG